MPLRPMVLWMGGAALLARAAQGHAQGSPLEVSPDRVVAAIRIKVDLSPSMDE